jgi:hypothetical protein
MSEIADTLRHNCEQALRTGLKFQEEAGRWWSSALSPAAYTEQWQQQLNAVTRTANSFVPLAQKPISQMIELMEKNSKTNAELMKKALEAAKTSVLEQSQAKWNDFWTSSLDATRSNTEAFSQITSNAIASWTSLVSNGS